MNISKTTILSLLHFLVISLSELSAFEKVVIWGHKLHSHTHSYIHQGFYDAFTHMGYTTYWLDNQDSTDDYDFTNALFITEGQVDQNIPLRNDGIYVTHNCSSKYNHLKQVGLQVYTDAVLNMTNLVESAPFIYFDYRGKGIFMPWATNLLPHQIDKIKEGLPFLHKQRTGYWIGSYGDGYFGNRTEIDPFILASKRNGIPFIFRGGNVSEEEHQRLISSCYLAPTIVGEWQKNVGYIPCRIFKNISYGQMGITNSRQVYELFEGKIIYNPDTCQLFYDAQEKLPSVTLDEIYELMDFVKTKHTYLNRVQTILEFIKHIGYAND